MSEKEVRDKPIPESKKELVKELSEKMTNCKTVMLASCKGLPGSQFHKIKKQLRGKADMKVVRKNAFERAINMTEKGALQELKKEADANFVILFSDIDAFELAGILSESQSSRKAKPGEEAPEDIEIEPGPTELIPGPAISELSGVGLKVAVKDGKLEIQKGATVVRAGEEIKENVASVLGKLNIEPMKAGFVPIAAYDAKDDKVYVGINIDKEGTLEEMKSLIGKALGFAINVNYSAKETISYFISKAASEEKAIEKLLGVEKKEEKVEETKEEEKPESEEKPAEETKEEAKPEEKVEEEPKIQENDKGGNE